MSDDVCSSSSAPAPAARGICHLEIAAPDLAQAQAFYGEVFGWTFRPMNDTYVLFDCGGVGGGLDSEMPVGDGGARPVIAVTDVDAALADIRAAGGACLSEKTPIGEGFGFYAYFRDPAGNHMGVWSRS